MAHVNFTAGAAQAVTGSEGYLRLATLTAAAANATATIKSNGTALYYLAALAGTTTVIAATTGGNQMAFAHIPGPVTVDVVGVGAQFTLDY